MSDVNCPIHNINRFSNWNCKRFASNSLNPRENTECDFAHSKDSGIDLLSMKYKWMSHAMRRYSPYLYTFIVAIDELSKWIRLIGESSLLRGSLGNVNSSFFVCFFIYLFFYYYFCVLLTLYESQLSHNEWLWWSSSGRTHEQKPSRPSN